jgi:hypothetical protein
MMENLTQREKTLAGVTAGALVVALLFGAFFWFLRSYNDNVAVLQGVDSRISDQENITLQGMQAGTRKRYYLQTSPTSDISDAKNQYIAWLKKTLREDIGVSLPRVDPGRNLTLKSDGKVVATQISFTIRPSVRLKQLVKFLNAFYSVDTLHRITTLKLTPKTESAGKKKTRTGELSTLIQIEVLALADGVKLDQLPASIADAGISLEAALDTIARRDVFGAANNSPALKINKGSSYPSGKSVSINVTASDADEEDVLVMELVESEVEGAELKPDARGKKGKLSLPGQPAGKYQFVIRVTDNGLPAKSTQEKVQITFKDPRKPAPPRPKPPPVKMAVETRITGNLKNADGSWCVLINSRMDGESYRLKEGESFELDGRDWEVTSISRKSATFEVDGQEVSLDRGVAFSEVELEE